MAAAAAEGHAPFTVQLDQEKTTKAKATVNNGATM